MSPFREFRRDTKDVACPPPDTNAVLQVAFALWCVMAAVGFILYVGLDIAGWLIGRETGRIPEALR